jgi:hypothetical protein
MKATASANGYWRCFDSAPLRKDDSFFLEASLGVA